MKISTEIASAARLVGEEKALEYLAKAGFDAWDFSMTSMCGYDYHNMVLIRKDHPLGSPDYLKFARRLKQIGLDNGIVCNQSHAPFPTLSMEMRPYLMRAIECTAEAGGEICVIHPWNYYSPEENAELYWDLLPFAKACGVKIATENMFNRDPNGALAVAACSTTESFLAHLQTVNDEDLVACLDIGHAELIGPGSGAVNMILALGDHLQSLHIHDNNKLNDSHAIPFSMDIDFAAVVKALKQIGYKGYFTLEASQHLKAFDADNIAKGVQELADSARKLVQMYDSLTG